MIRSSRTTTQCEFSRGKIGYGLRCCKLGLLERRSYFIKCDRKTVASYLYLFVKISTCYTMSSTLGALKEIHDLGPDLMEFLVCLQDEIDKN